MFRAEDQDQDGVIQIDYEKFLFMILNSNLLWIRTALSGLLEADHRDIQRELFLHHNQKDMIRIDCGKILLMIFNSDLVPGPGRHL